MKSTKAREELTDNPLEYYQYMRQQKHDKVRLLKLQLCFIFLKILYRIYLYICKIIILHLLFKILKIFDCRFKFSVSRKPNIYNLWINIII